MSPASNGANHEVVSGTGTVAPSSIAAVDPVHRGPPPSKPVAPTGQIDRKRVRGASDPFELARAFRDYLGGNATTFAGNVYRFNGTKYVIMSDADLRCEIYTFLDKARSQKTNRVATPNIGNVKEIASAFKALTLLSSGKAPPCWKGPANGNADALVVCANGILNLTTRQLENATPDFFTLTALDYTFEPSRNPPWLWLEFLGQVFPDNPAAIDLLQEVFGYLLVPDTGQQKIFVLHGPRRSGKGTTLRVLTRLLGRDNVVATDLFALGERFGLSPLLGHHVATIGDAGRLGNSGRALQRLLSISAEDAVTLDRKLDPEMWSGRLSVRFVIATNSIRDLADPHGALASRLLAIPFRHSFLGLEDPTLSDRLAKELPGILNWAIDGWRRLKERGRFGAFGMPELELGMPADIEARVARFVAEQCQLGPEHLSSKEGLFDTWTEWCRSHGMPPGDPARFGRALLALGNGAIHSAKPRNGSSRRLPIYTGICPRERPPRED